MDAVTALSGTIASLRAIRDAQAMPLRIQLDNLVVRLDGVLTALRADLPTDVTRGGLYAVSDHVRADGRVPLTMLHAGDMRQG